MNIIAQRLQAVTKILSIVNLINRYPSLLRKREFQALQQLRFPTVEKSGVLTSKIPKNIENTNEGEMLRIFKQIRDELKSQKRRHETEVKLVKEMTAKRNVLNKELGQVKKEQANLPRAIKRFKQKILTDFGSASQEELDNFGFLTNKANEISQVSEDTEFKLEGFSKNMISKLVTKLCVSGTNLKRELEQKVENGMIITLTEKITPNYFETESTLKGSEDSHRAESKYCQPLKIEFYFLKVEGCDEPAVALCSAFEHININTLLNFLKRPSRPVFHNESQTAFQNLANRLFARADYSLVSNLASFLKESLQAFANKVKIRQAFKCLAMVKSNPQNPGRFQVWQTDHSHLRSLYLPFWLKAAIERKSQNASISGTDLKEEDQTKCEAGNGTIDFRKDVSDQDLVLMIRVRSDMFVLVICFEHKLDPMQKVFVGVYSQKSRFRLTRDLLENQGLYCVILDPNTEGEPNQVPFYHLITHRIMIDY